MRWTPENVARLFRTICETHDLTINVETASKNWPVSPEDEEKPPTGKAIKVFLGKYKKTLKPGASLNISFDTNGPQGPDGVSSSPRKRKSSAASKPTKKAKANDEEMEGIEEE